MTADLREGWQRLHPLSPVVRGGRLTIGIATVRLHTAAAATDARIPGLESDEAARLRDRLAELGEAQAAGL